MRTLAKRHRRAGPAIVTARSSQHIIGQISPVWFPDQLGKNVRADGVTALVHEA